jgi:hypothetical protein
MSNHVIHVAIHIINASIHIHYSLKVAYIEGIFNKVGWEGLLGCPKGLSRPLAVSLANDQRQKQTQLLFFKLLL